MELQICSVLSVGSEKVHVDYRKRHQWRYIHDTVRYIESDEVSLWMSGLDRKSPLCSSVYIVWSHLCFAYEFVVMSTKAFTIVCDSKRSMQKKKNLKLEYILISWNMHTPSYLVALCISTCLATRKYEISSCAPVTDVLIPLPANRKPITHTLSNYTAHCWRHTELLLLIWLWLSVTSQHK